MSGFRGDDETLEREIDALERVAQLRLKRSARDLKDLDRELRVLKRERARRRSEAESHAAVPVPSGPVEEHP